MLPKVSVIVSKELRSVGDVLRELDNRMTSDFVLVNGDTVGNVNLSAAIEEHKKRRQTDKNAIMTMVLKQASVNHASRSRGEESVFVLDSETSECVHYEPLHSSSTLSRKKKMNLDLEILQKHPNVDIRNDLIDSQVDICSIEVPALFTENFDYQDIRRDFVKGILESDLLGKTLFCHVLKDKYAVRVTNPQMYDAVSKDVLGRWTFPMVPDLNWSSTPDHQELILPSLYKGKNVTLSG